VKSKDKVRQSGEENDPGQQNDDAHGGNKRHRNGDQAADKHKNPQMIDHPEVFPKAVAGVFVFMFIYLLLSTLFETFL
jgi:hypothetical protein